MSLYLSQSIVGLMCPDLAFDVLTNATFESEYNMVLTYDVGVE